MKEKEEKRKKKGMTIYLNLYLQLWTEKWWDFDFFSDVVKS